MCVQYQLLGITAGGQLLMILHYVRQELKVVAMTTIAHFFCGDKRQKNLFLKCSFLNFWKKVRLALSQGAASKTTTFLEPA